MKLFFISLVCVALLIPQLTHAHEVYVLSHDDMTKAMNTDSPNPFTAMTTNTAQFIGWGIGIIFGLLIALRISFFKPLEKKLTPLLRKIKKYAPMIERISLALALFSSAYAFSLFGPEIALTAVAGKYALFVQLLLYLGALLFLFGWYTRIAAGMLLVIFVIACVNVGGYLITYLNYGAAALLLIVLGSRGMSAGGDGKKEELAFFILRVCYGIAIIFGATYAKLMHSNLALETIGHYHLINYFHFSPMFLVLGALLVEYTIGLCIMLGVELRLALIVFTVFLVMSLLFFGEVVWPHIILFGLNITLFVRGYDKYTFLSRFSRNNLEPLL